MVMMRVSKIHGGIANGVLLITCSYSDSSVHRLRRSQVKKIYGFTHVQAFIPRSFYHYFNECLVIRINSLIMLQRRDVTQHLSRTEGPNKHVAKPRVLTSNNFNRVISTEKVRP